MPAENTSLIDVGEPPNLLKVFFVTCILVVVPHFSHVAHAMSFSVYHYVLFIKLFVISQFNVNYELHEICMNLRITIVLVTALMCSCRELWTTVQFFL